MTEKMSKKYKITPKRTAPMTLLTFFELSGHIELIPCVPSLKSFLILQVSLKFTYYFHIEYETPNKH